MAGCQLSGMLCSVRWMNCAEGRTPWLTLSRNSSWRSSSCPTCNAKNVCSVEARRSSSGTIWKAQGPLLRFGCPGIAGAPEESLARPWESLNTLRSCGRMGVGKGMLNQAQYICRESDDADTESEGAVKNKVIVELDWNLLFSKGRLALLAAASLCSLQHFSAGQAIAADEFNRRSVGDVRAGRRHHRRRLSKEVLESHSDNSAASGSASGSEDDGNVTLVIDFEEVKQKAGKAMGSVKGRAEDAANGVKRAAQRAVQEAKQTVDDLRSAIQFQPGGRLVVSIRRDFFQGPLLVLAIVIFLSIARKWLWRLFHFLGFGWSEHYGGRERIVRDRSLGGREVRVGNPRSSPSITPTASSFKPTTSSWSDGRLSNPLDDGRRQSRSEQDLRKQQRALPVKRKISLPPWWVPMEPPLDVNGESKEQGRREAQAFLEGMLDRRLGGSDFSEQDILELRWLCWKSGVSVFLPTSNTRDALYRAAVNVAIAASARGGSIGVNPVSAPKFVSGFAGAIGVEEERAASIASAAVAARMRSAFLQAWALLKQERKAEAKEELAAIASILSVYPPDPSAPEVDMVARGIVPRLAREDRQEVLSLYGEAGGKQTEPIAAAALGLETRRRPPPSFPQ